jgi:hypothetical protein
MMQAQGSMQSKTPSIEDLMATVESLRSEIESVLSEETSTRGSRRREKDSDNT